MPIEIHDHLNRSEKVQREEIDFVKVNKNKQVVDTFIKL
jgi:hypothetical protein